MGKNQQALALAFRKCRGKLLKIKELGITPDMKEKDIEALIEKRAEEKVADDSTIDINEAVTNQRWYVEMLVKFSGMTTEKQFEAEYADSFADTASEPEMITVLDEIKAA